MARVPILKKALAIRKGQKAVEHSLYFGRERLGRYVKLDRKRYKAFDARDRLLGKFVSRTRALDAIRKAWAKPDKNGTVLSAVRVTHVAAALAKSDSRTRELHCRESPNE